MGKEVCGTREGMRRQWSEWWTKEIMRMVERKINVSLYGDDKEREWTG